MSKSSFVISTCLFVSSVLFAQISLANPMRPDPITEQSVKPQSTTNTTPIVKAQRKLPRLSNILIIGSYRIAIFNGTNERQVGETIAGYKVIKIEATHVELRRGSKTTLLELKTTGELVISPADED